MEDIIKNNKKGNIKMIELALKPKFPNTNININASISDMSREELLKTLDNLLKSFTVVTTISSIANLISVLNTSL